MSAKSSGVVCGLGLAGPDRLVVVGGGDKTPPSATRQDIWERTTRGWMTHYAIMCDALLGIGRYAYWEKAICERKVPDEPIPEIKIIGCPREDAQCLEAMQNIKECLDPFEPNVEIETLIDWILFGMNSPLVKEFPKKINPEMNEHFYRKFNLALMMRAPADYFAAMADRRFKYNYAHRFSGNGAWFATPSHVAQAMAMMAMDTQDKKTASVMDPCCGTGILLLHASNYSLRLFGWDIQNIMIKMAALSAYLWVPWLVVPCEALFENPVYPAGLIWGDSLMQKIFGYGSHNMEPVKQDGKEAA